MLSDSNTILRVHGCYCFLHHWWALWTPSWIIMVYDKRELLWCVLTAFGLLVITQHSPVVQNVLAAIRSNYRVWITERCTNPIAWLFFFCAKVLFPIWKLLQTWEYFSGLQRKPFALYGSEGIIFQLMGMSTVQILRYCEMFRCFCMLQHNSTFRE